MWQDEDDIDKGYEEDPEDYCYSEDWKDDDKNDDEDDEKDKKEDDEER